MSYIRRIILALFVASALPLGAEDPVHPRVAEVEQSLASQAHAYLTSRFPGMPFLVTVKVDPMFRSERNVSGAKGEQLPYFDLSSEEILDEWDDPGKSLLQLQRRVRKTVVSVAVPNQLPESEAVEIRESIISFLHLNGARDEVYINRKNWRTHSIEWMQVLLIGSGLLLFLLGMLWINRISSGRIANALEESARKSAGMSAPPPVVNSAMEESASASGDVQMHDPVKLKDLAVRTIDTLCQTPGFPSHLDVMALNEVGRKNPAALGAILVEFPAAVQERLFAYSTEESWLNALNEPGVLDFESLMVLRKLLRNNHLGDQTAWSALVLSVWRLTTDQRIDFLKKVQKQEAIQLLKALPKGMALSTARKLFPGSWAEILDSSTAIVAIKPERCEELARNAQAMAPLRTLSMLSQYRDELEILGHLNLSDPYEEREIYQVLPKNSRILESRPPFFRVFDVEDEIRKELFTAFAIDQWARALLDVKTSDRQKIEAFFSEKQQFLFTETQKQIKADSTKEREQIGRLRLQIAHYLRQLESKAESIKAASTNEPGMMNEPFKEAA